MSQKITKNQEVIGGQAQEGYREDRTVHCESPFRSVIRNGPTEIGLERRASITGSMSQGRGDARTITRIREVHTVWKMSGSSLMARRGS